MPRLVVPLTPATGIRSSVPFAPILLKKSLLADERNFSAPQKRSTDPHTSLRRLAVRSMWSTPRDDLGTPAGRSTSPRALVVNENMVGRCQMSFENAIDFGNRLLLDESAPHLIGN